MSRVRRGFWCPPGTPARERIIAMSEAMDGGCWIWQANRKSDGYGRIGMGDKKTVFAHRVSYEAFVGVIPPGLTVDHLCFTPACVNPEHLRLVTKSENSSNQRRSNRDRCGRGHELTPENTFASRRSDAGNCCLTCKRDYQREWMRSYRKGRAA